MSLEAELAGRLRGSVVVLGIGNALRGDDAAGSALARRLEGRVRALVVDAEEVPESYLGRIRAAHPDTVLLVDAVDMGAAPGAVALVEAEEVAGYTPSTHRVPLGLLMGYLGRELGASVVLLAVQPRHVNVASHMSAEVQASVALVGEVLERLMPPAPARGSGQAKVEGSWSC